MCLDSVTPEDFPSSDMWLTYDAAIRLSRWQPQRVAGHLAESCGKGQHDERLPQLVQEFERTVCAPDFPCFFAGPAMTSSNMAFAYFGGGDEDEARAYATEAMWALADRIKLSPELTGVLFLDTESRTIVEDQGFASSLIDYLQEAGSSEWPKGHTMNTSDPSWTLWINGVSFFLNVSTPHHVLRRSRNVGSAFTVVAQARHVFDSGAARNPSVRARIRSRISVYDAVPVHPALKAYGDPENREIDQYFLGDK